MEPVMSQRGDGSLKCTDIMYSIKDLEASGKYHITKGN